MIIWNHINGVIGSYRTGQWVGNQDDPNSGIIITYDTDKESSVFLLDGQIPNAVAPYFQPENHRVILRGIVQASDIYRTYKFVFRAETTDGEIDDTYCEFLVDNTINEAGESLGWKTSQSDIPDNWQSYSQPVIIEGTTSRQMRFELNSSAGKQNFYKIFGELPPGISLSSDGYLTGTFEGVEESTRYDFTIRCDVTGVFDDEIRTLTFDRDFYIIVNPASEMINPVFLNDNLFLNNIDYGNYGEFNVSAFIIPSQVLRYEITKGELPASLQLGRFNGIISGYCTEVGEKRFEFEVTCYCDATGGQASHTYQIGTNSIEYSADIVYPESGSAFSYWRVGDYVYQEIVIENSEHYYTFDTKELYRVIPKGLAVSYLYRQAGDEKYQSVCIISGLLQPQTESSTTFDLYWSYGNIKRGASFTMTVLMGKSADLAKLYIQLPHEFLEDWVEQYEVFTQLPECTVYGEFHHDYLLDENGDIVVDSNGNPVPDEDSELTRDTIALRQFDNMVYNLNTDVYAFKNLPKIYLRNSSTLSQEQVDEIIGTFDYPLDFKLSGLQYAEYRNSNGELVYYVIYRDIIENGFGEITVKYAGKGVPQLDADGNPLLDADGHIIYTYPEADSKNITLPTFEELRNRINSIETEDDELLEWEKSWSPKLVLMYVRPNALTQVLALLNQYNSKFIEKRYIAQYICREPYFYGQFKDSVCWFQSYNAMNPVQDWRDGQYLGNTPIQPLNPYPEMPVVQNYNIITDKETPNFPEYNIATESGDVLITDLQVIIPDPE